MISLCGDIPADASAVDVTGPLAMRRRLPGRQKVDHVEHDAIGRDVMVDEDAREVMMLMKAELPMCCS